MAAPHSPDRPEPVIVPLPSGRARLAPIIRSYGLEGDSVEDLEERHRPQKGEPIVIEDGDDLFCLCEKESPEIVEVETEIV
jgi:hypothetical protein